MLSYLLEVSGYDHNLAVFLTDGFTNGFKLGHAAPLRNNEKVPQVKKDEADIIQEKLKHEIAMGRVAGPFDSPPFKHFQLSPLFLRPKSTPGEFRMILNLSYPKKFGSINKNIADTYKSVKYSSVRQGIKTATELGKGCYTAKVDIKDAFRLLPIHQQDLPKLCFKNKSSYYYDKVLPQGCSSSCFLFEKFATALHHILDFFILEGAAIHYLDDFLIFGNNYEDCLLNRDLFIHICNILGIPLSPKKITLPATNTTFLGITIDTEEQCAKLPIEKIRQYRDDIQKILNLHEISLKELQSIVGKLNFAASVVPARAFLRRLIDLIPQTEDSIELDEGAKLDLKTWVSFLSQYNGITFFRSLQIMDGKTINLGADASHKGFGATYRSRWIQAKYPESWASLHITLLEFFPIFVLIAMYGLELRNAVVVFHTDNMAVKCIINSSTSSHPTVMFFLRKLILLLLDYNIDLRAVHVPGKKNQLCDAISRFQITRDMLQEHNMLEVQDTIPQQYLPEAFSII